MRATTQSKSTHPFSRPNDIINPITTPRLPFLVFLNLQLPTTNGATIDPSSTSSTIKLVPHRFVHVLYISISLVSSLTRCKGVEVNHVVVVLLLLRRARASSFRCVLTATLLLLLLLLLSHVDINRSSYTFQLCFE